MIKRPYGVWMQRKGSKPSQLYAFKTYEQAEKACYAAYLTLNEFTSGTNPWKTWVDTAVPDDFLGDLDDGLQRVDFNSAGRAKTEA